MNLNGSAVVIKKRAADPELREDIEALMDKCAPILEKRDKGLAKKGKLIEDVKEIKAKSLENLEELVFNAAKNSRERGLNVFVAKKPVDIAEYIRGFIGREKLGIMPSPQTVEAEVMQAFFMSNKVDVVSNKYAGQDSGKATIHPYFPYPQEKKKAEKSEVEYVILSALVLTENGNVYLEEEELKELKNSRNHIIIVTADRVFSEKDADKVAHLMDIASGGVLKSEKTDFKGHLIILDNGRQALSRGNLKEILLCINCYGCSLHCPVYKTVGGLFGAPTMSGIGSLAVSYQSGLKAGITRGLNYCTMCGKCEVECPVDVPIMELIERMRKKAEFSGL